MLKIENFVFSIESEMRDIVIGLKVVVDVVSDLRGRLADFKLLLEDHQSNVLGGSVGYYNHDFLCSLHEMQDVLKLLSGSLIKLLATYGKDLYKMRDKVIFVKKELLGTPSSSKISQAIDNLVEKIDQMCDSIERNLEYMSNTLKSLENKWLV